MVGAVLAGPGPTVGAQQVRDDVEISSVDAVGPQTIRGVVTVPPSFDQVALRPESFAVTVNGSLVAARVARDEQPLDVVLAIDVSGSMKGDALAAAKTAANGFVLRVPTGGRIGVVAFGASVAVNSPLSADHSRAVNAVAGLSASGETALYDGLRSAAGMFDSPTARRVVVLLSDGRDTVSGASSADAAAAQTLTLDPKGFLGS